MTAPVRTTVVNVRTAPAGSYVYVGRAVPPRFPATPWGNPWRVPRDGTAEEVLARYRAHVLASPELLVLLPTLRGKVLGCWCAPAPCHADVLAELADALPPALAQDAAGVPEPGTEAWGQMNRRRGELIQKKNREGLSDEERAEYEAIQRRMQAKLERTYSAATIWEDKIAQIEERLNLPATPFEGGGGTP